MAGTVVYKVEGLDRIIAALGEIAGMTWAKGLIDAALANVQESVSVYPAASEANQPRGFTSGGDNRWYERGFGPRWARKDGSIGGAKTSQMLGRKWAHTVKQETGMIVGEIGNNASYAAYVHGQDTQQWYHLARGWRVIEPLLEQARDAVQEEVMDKIASIWGKA
jgi:hypothetical protein